MLRRLSQASLALLLAAVACSAAGARPALASVAGTTLVLAKTAPRGLHVAGNRLVSRTGQPLAVIGVNRSGSEYACAQGWGIFDGPVDDRSIAAMASWGIDAVRIPLNEDCWLNINAVPRAYAGVNYRAAISSLIARLQAHGLDVILDLHWGAPGHQLALGQEQAPDASHAAAFWSSVAHAYRGNAAIAFDLFNEPHDISWSCWRAGCITPGGWRATGMQQLLDAVRHAGARQPVILEGLGWGGDLSGWLANHPSDPARQLVAGWHIYNFSACVTANCWSATVGGLARRYPVLATEVGENDCSGSFLNTLLPWADLHHIGYLAWAWNAASCGGGPSLISSYSGTPTPFGEAFRAHVLSLRVQPLP